MNSISHKMLMAWKHLSPKYLPFADAASPDLPLSRLLRLSLFQVSVGMALVLLVGTLNRVMIVELHVSATLVSVMISIPLSLAIGLILMNALGYGLNQLSIVGLVVALGLLVDDSIVVVENIERWIREGYSKKEAALKATQQISLSWDSLPSVPSGAASAAALTAS